MKTSIKYLVAIFAIAFTFVSCSNDDETTVNELDGITKIKEITNDTHTIELYSQMGSLRLRIYIQIIWDMIVKATLYSLMLKLIVLEGC